MAITLNNRGSIYTNRRQFDRAITDFNIAIRLKPDFAEFHYNRGFAYRRMGEYDKAVQNFSQAIRLKPDYVWAYGNRAWARYLMGKNVEALQDVNEALSLKPGADLAINLMDTRAHVLMALERRQEALSEFERVIQIGGAKWVRDYQEALQGHGYDPGSCRVTCEPVRRRH